MRPALTEVVGSGSRERSIEIEIEAATARWAAAFADDDPAAIIDLYDDEAVLWGTLSPTVAVGKPALRAYFELAFARLPGHRVRFGAGLIRTHGDVAISTGAYTFDYSIDGEPQQLPARYTFVYRKRGRDWIIVDHHSSAMPEAPS